MKRAEVKKRAPSQTGWRLPFWGWGPKTVSRHRAGTTRPHLAQAYNYVKNLPLKEFLPLAALFIPGVLILAFAHLADEVMEGETRHIDESVLLALRNPADLADPIGPQWVEQVVKDTTSLGSVTVLTLITLGTVIYLLMAKKRPAALLVLLSVGGGTLLSTLLKSAFNRPRPELVAHIVDVSTASFPSGHAMLSAVTYLTLGALLARTEPNLRLKTFILGAAIFLTVAIGLSRLYLGVHYPSDVLAGWTLGAGWALLCLTAANLYLRKTTPTSNL
jgi:undecaprenyl-diphosphatase